MKPSRSTGPLQRLVRLPWACEFSWDWKGWWFMDQYGYKTTHLVSFHKTTFESGVCAYGVIVVWVNLYIWSRNQKPNAKAELPGQGGPK